MIVSILLAALVFLQTLLLGANRSDLALGFSSLWFLTLPLLLTQAWARDAVDRLDLRWSAIAFGAVIAIGLLSIMPTIPDWSNPTWRWVPGVRPIVSIAPYATLVELVKLTALGAAFMAGAMVGAGNRAESLIRALLLFGLAYGLWAFLDHLLSPTLLFGAARPFDEHRLSASFGSANTAATLFGVVVILNVVYLLRIFRRGGGSASRTTRLNKAAPEIAFCSIGLAVAVTCLVLTLSRTGIAATVVVSLVTIAILGMAPSKTNSRRYLWAVPSLLFVVIAFSTVAMNLSSIQDRFGFLGADSQRREAIAQIHWHAFTLAPWWGYGLGTFDHINAMAMNGANLDTLRTLGAAHNVYVEWLEQAGVVGSLTMWGCLGLISLKTALGAARSRPVRAWPVAALAILMLFLIHGANDYAFEVPSAAAFLSLIFGCGFGASRPKLHSPVARERTAK